MFCILTFFVPYGILLRFNGTHMTYIQTACGRMNRSIRAGFAWLFLFVLQGARQADGQAENADAVQFLSSEYLGPFIWILRNKS